MTVDATAALHEGLAHHQAGRIDAAETAYRAVLARIPDQPDALHLLGVVAYQRGRRHEAIALYRRALAMAPGHPALLNNLATALKDEGALDEARRHAERALTHTPDFVEALNTLGNIRLLAGDIAGAIAALSRAVAVRPDYAVAHVSLGQVLMRAGRPADAAAAFARVAALRPVDPVPENERGMALEDAGRREAAIEAYRCAIARDPRFAPALSNLGAALEATGALDEAAALLERAVAIDPGLAAAHLNLGTVRHRLVDPDAAIASYRRAIEIDPADAEAHNNLGNVLLEEEDYPGATAAYDRALGLDPDNAEAHSNLGIARQREGDYAAAEASYARALALAPGLAQAHHNHGTLMRELNRLDEALASFRRAVELDPGLADAHDDLGLTLIENRQPRLAVDAFRQSIAVAPSNPYAYIHLANVLANLGETDEALAAAREAMRLGPEIEAVPAALVRLLQEACAWDEIPDVLRLLDSQTDKALAEGRVPIASPFHEARTHFDEARTFAVAVRGMKELEARMGSVRPRFDLDSRRAKEGRLRIGYLSYDFRDHPIAHLIGGVFPRHDRSRFEITAYSLGPDDKSVYRRRTEADCDRFVDLNRASHVEAAQRIYDDVTDILVDLTGTTLGGRLQIHALRPAPISVWYLGYPTTTGARFIDYTIVDKTVVPPANAIHYSEQLAYMPNAYQATDIDQEIADRRPSRAECGLPDQGFVFASFNQSYKIEPEMFDAWMRILARVPGSVLWILQPNRTAERNLRRFAEASGLARDRLIFGERLPKERHLARLARADLGLDTRIYNGHTTTNDALWAGLPVLTLMGTHFPSRVSASLLRAMGLPELVVTELAAYEAAAVRLAESPAELAGYRARIAATRTTAPLFDTPRFVRDLERLYERMWARFAAGLPPAMISLED